MNAVLPADERRATRRALGLLRISKAGFAWSVLAGSLTLVCSVCLAAISAWLIARASQMPLIPTLAVAATAVRMFGASKPVLRYFRQIASHRVALYGMSNLRSAVYETLADSRIDAVASIRRGDLLARTGRDVSAVGDLVVRALDPIAVACVTSVFSVALIAYFSPACALVLALCLLAAGLASPYCAMRGARIAELSQIEDRAELAALSLTMLDSASELRVSGRLAELEAAAARAEERIFAHRDAAARPTALATAIDSLAMGVAVVASIVIGAGQLASGQLAAVELAIVVLTPLAAFEATMPLAGAGIQLVRSAGASKRILDLLDSARPAGSAEPGNEGEPSGDAEPGDGAHPAGDAQPGGGDRPADSASGALQAGMSGASQTETPDAPQAETSGAPQTGTGDRWQTDTSGRPQPGTGDAPQSDTGPTPHASAGDPQHAGTGEADETGLTATGLHIGWPGGGVVAGPFDLHIPRGATLAIVGPSGIGKSTLLYTLAGLLPPKSGSVTLDGRHASTLARDEVSRTLVLTAEDAHVFATTVLENIRVARADVTEEEAVDLLHRAGLAAWLAELPEGVHTMLGHNATTISGGERRRLLFARALASPARYLLLDEPAEHLDGATADALISDLITAGTTPGERDRTIVIVTHRLSPLAGADRVILLSDDAGSTRVAAAGTHEELASLIPDYRWSVQQEG